MVGDFVEADGEAVTRVLPRINSLARPAVANIGQAVIVVASEPEPDFYLVDKMLINCRGMDIDAVLCLNKIDLRPKKLYNTLVEQFGRDAEIIKASAERGDTGALNEVLRGKLSALCGQSAVGKSSLINVLAPNADRRVGELSGNKRGRNTTTGSGLIDLGAGTYVIDTPGFGSLDIFGVDYRELDGYYADYIELAARCRFAGCSHITEPDCAVKDAVEAGKLDKDRYRRYMELRTMLK